MRLETRIERLESAMVPGSAETQYDNRADYNGHLGYAVGNDGSVVVIDTDLNVWPDEQSLWASHPTGTKFLRLNGGEVAEIIDGVVRGVRFAPVKMVPDTIQALDELHHDIVGEWPKRGAEVVK